MRAAVVHDGALLLKLNELAGGATKDDETAWVDNLVVTAPLPLDIDDQNDDLKRELAFYNQALGAVRVAQQRFEAIGVPHARPSDYFAQMIKSDKHMEKVKRRMLREKTELEAKDARRKQAQGKKFGKQVQRATLVARAEQKNRDIAAVTKLRKQSKSQAQDDGFDVGVDDSHAEQSVGSKRARGDSFSGKGGGGGSEGAAASAGKRAWKEKRWGKKGLSARDRKNTAESSADDRGFKGGRGAKGGGKGGGTGGAKGGRGKGGGTGGAIAKKRAGKDARQRGR